MDVDSNEPKPRFLAAPEVVSEMCRHSMHRLRTLHPMQLLVLAIIGGALITAGALFSVLLSQGVSAPGLQRLLQGVGFSTGFFFVILSSTILFTETNVALPAVLLHHRTRPVINAVLMLWLLAWLGNFIGAFLLGNMINLSQDLAGPIQQGLTDLVEKKMHFQKVGTATAWFQAMLSGVLANWLVGMAAFFATMGRTIMGKYIPVLLAVTLFVAANLQHSPANMGYFALTLPLIDQYNWWDAFCWNLIPAGIGNILGGIFLVALPFWYALPPDSRRREREYLREYAETSQ